MAVVGWLISQWWDYKMKSLGNKIEGDLVVKLHRCLERPSERSAQNVTLIVAY